MCGIVGIWGTVDPQRVRMMNRRLAHRGPDGSAVHVEPGRATLGHHRLAIIDPKKGDQPLHSPDGSALIIANGEVYNHERLRSDLPSEFATTSDSETALHLLQADGDRALAQLDGMFAFAVVDREGLLLARDPVGIKPLYYGRSDDEQALHFASEVRALAPWVSSVQEFPPGHYYRSGRDFEQYFRLPQPPKTERETNSLLTDLRHRLDAAVRKRLMSDVPLGAFLSGGLDSSITAALARRHRDELHTFSVGVEGSTDLQAARLVADHIGSRHHEYVYSPEEVRAALPQIVTQLESFDRDLVRSAIPTWFCSRLAAQHVKVILTGEGADELFAGYSYYKQYDDMDSLHQELQRSVANLHNMNLQRVDRMTMAHGLEGRVPYLDIDFIELAASIPAEHKLPTDRNGRPVEKWILRKAFEHLLPDQVVWRDKEQFDEGSGTLDVLAPVIDHYAGKFDVQSHIQRYPQDRLRDREEAVYHQLLLAGLEHPEAVLPTVARWQH